MQIVIDLKDKASKQLSGINKQFGKASGGITKSVGAIGAGISSIALPAVAAVGGIGLAVGKSVSVFADFQKAIANAASVTGATGKAFEDTKKNIEDVSNILGKTTVHRASDAANAFYDLASAGYDVANMTKSDLEPILNIASATQNELSYTTGVVTSTLGQFGLKIKDSAKVADVFAKTIGSSKATLRDLEYSMKYVGPVANSMGMGIEQVNAILGNLYNAGFKGEQAGTALRGAFSRLLNPTTAMVNQLEAMGLTLDDVDPITHDFADVLDTLSDAGMDTSSAMKLFGVEAAPAMLALTSTTPDIRKLEKALYGAGGTAKTMADQQLDTLSGAFALIGSTVEGVMISVGKTFAPLVSRIADVIVDIIPKIHSFAYGIGTELLPKIIAFAGKLKEDLQPGLDAMLDMVDSIIRILSDLYTEFKDSESAMGTMTSVVGGLVDAFNFLAEGWATIYDFFADHPTLTKAVGAIAIAVALITVPILAIVAALGVLAVAWDQNWFGIKDTIVRIADIVVEKVGWWLGELETLWGDHGDTITSVVGIVWGSIEAVISNAMDTINTVINVFLDLIEGDWSGAWDRIVGLADRSRERCLKIFDDFGIRSIESFAVSMNSILSGITTAWGNIVSVIVGAIDNIISDITTGWSDVFTIISTTMDNILSDTSGGWSNILSEISTSMGNIVSVVTGHWGNILSEISTSMNNITSIVRTGWSTIDDVTGGRLSDMLSTVRTSFDNMKTAINNKLNDIKTTISNWFNNVKAFFDFSKHKIKWPKITNPFAGINWCGFIDSKWHWAVGCGGSPPHNKSAPHDKSHNKSSDGGHTKGTYGHTKTTPHDKSAVGCYADFNPCYTKMSYQQGGPVKNDVTADVHKGEWVVPKKGALVMTDSKPGHVKITYNFGNVYGVNDLEKLLDKHDRDLYRKLESLT